MKKKSFATYDPPRMTPRVKSIAIKYHWFQEHLVKGEVHIEPIITEEQLADILMKPLLPLKFET